MIAFMTAAIITASAALIAVLLTQFMAEAYRRFKDGSAFAAGIWGELAAYSEVFPVWQGALSYWQLMETDHTAQTLRVIDRPVDPYFSEVVGKIGVLGPDLVGDIAYVYAQLNGFRIGLEVMSNSFRDMEAEEFRKRAAGCAALLGNAAKRGEVLIPRLRERADENFLSRRKLVAFWKSMR